MTAQKEQLASEGRYLEAEAVKQKILELKSGFSGQKKRDLTYQHSSEMKNLEENYNGELMRINEIFEEKAREFEENYRISEDNLNNKHKREMDELLEHLEQKLPRTIKYSREYLDLKQSEANCVKQER